MEHFPCRDLPAEPRDPICELDFAEHGRRVDHRVVRSEPDLDPGAEEPREVRRHAEEGVRAWTDDDGHTRVRAPLEIRGRRADHVDEERGAEIKDGVDVLADALGTVDSEWFARPARGPPEPSPLRPGPGRTPPPPPAPPPAG